KLLYEKKSWHRVISTHSPQYVFAHNKEGGAAHLAERVRQFCSEAVGAAVDSAVYSKNRLMRMVFSSKAYKPKSILQLLPRNGKTVDLKRALITWLDENTKTIDVPVRRPSATSAPAHKSHNFVSGARPKPRQTQSVDGTLANKALKIMTEREQSRLHLSAYLAGGAVDLFDASKGAKFNYRDRSEPCFTDAVHDGAQNFCCYVDSNEDLIVRCFSDKCKSQYVNLGPLHSEEEEFTHSSIRINNRYISEPGSKRKQDVIQQWIDGEVKPLSLKSVMDTGKTTWVEQLLDEFFGGRSILFLTYRQSLAGEISKRFPSFTNYLTTPTGLSNRERHPHVICQIESFSKLVDDEVSIPEFDVVICDEVESLLNYMSSSTVKDPGACLRKIVRMAQKATHILTMDAFFSDVTFRFLDLMKVSQRVIVNTWRSPLPRTFSFTHDEPKWMTSITTDLTNGKNVVIVSMSSEMCAKVKKLATPLVGGPNIIEHTSKSDDVRKHHLRENPTFWTAARLLLYTPTIEAGVNFNIEHFDRMYFYGCLMSTTPLGAAQMLGRIRKLREHTIHCLVPKNLSLTQWNPKTTYEEMQRRIQWIYNKSDDPLLPLLRQRCVTDYFRCEGGGEALLVVGDPVTHIFAANKTRRINAQTRFFPEFRTLIESQGHKVIVADTKVPRKGKADELSERIKHLINDTLLSNSEYACACERLAESTAPSEDKWAVQKTAFCQSWGVHCVNAAFADATSAKYASRNASILLLHAVLFQTLDANAIHTGRDSHIAEQVLPIKVTAMRDIFTALGVRHPFDVTTRFDLLGRLDALKETSVFKEPMVYREFLTKKPKDDDNNNIAHDVKSLSTIVNTVLRSCGLRLEGKVLSQLYNKPRVYEHQIQELAARNMMELTWMANSRAPPSLPIRNSSDGPVDMLYLERNPSKEFVDLMMVEGNGDPKNDDAERLSPQ
ncbi:hypothetical protein HKX48_000438, partial [Thoreauomyces humboldtii]